MEKGQKKIASIYKALDSTAKSTLLDFAEFLLARSGVENLQNETKDLQEPVHETAPESESVIAALKRMRRVYPMLETGDLFNEASSLVTSNLMGGRPAREVVDEIETLFDKYYQEYVNTFVTQ